MLAVNLWLLTVNFTVPTGNFTVPTYREFYGTYRKFYGTYRKISGTYWEKLYIIDQKEPFVIPYSSLGDTTDSQGDGRSCYWTVNLIM